MILLKLSLIMLFIEILCWISFFSPFIPFFFSNGYNKLRHQPYFIFFLIYALAMSFVFYIFHDKLKQDLFVGLLNMPLTFIISLKLIDSIFFKLKKRHLIIHSKWSINDRNEIKMKDTWDDIVYLSLIIFVVIVSLSLSSI